MSLQPGYEEGVTPAVLSATTSPYVTKHIPISTWLEALGLAEYEKLFQNYNGVEDLLSLTEADIRDLGIRNSAHRARMVSTLVIYKEKTINKKMSRTPRNGTPAGSPGSTPHNTPPSLAMHPDYAAVHVPVTQSGAAHIAQVLMGVSTSPTNPGYQDLSQFGWFHGKIPRPKAEKVVKRDGDFLVRDSISKPGDYVLTVCWKGAPLHFVINKQVVGASTGKPRIQFQFEENLFDRPSDLILHYLDCKRQITELSGAIISTPVIRIVPLEYYDSSTPDSASNAYQTISHTRSPWADGASPRGSPWGSPKGSPLGSPQTQRKPKRTGSQPLLSLDDDLLEPPQPISRKSSMPSLNQKLSTPPSNTADITSVPIPFPRPTAKADDPVPAPRPNEYPSLKYKSSPKVQKKGLPIHHRTGSEPVMSPSVVGTNPFDTKPGFNHQLSSSDEHLPKAPPPKPSRVPTVKKRPGEKKPVVQIRNKDLYDDDDGRDYSDYDQVKSWPSHLQKSARAQADILRNSTKPISTYDVPKNPNIRKGQFMYDVPKNIHAAGPFPTDEVTNALFVRQFTLPRMDNISAFDLNKYDSELLTPNNKPLEPSAITTIKTLFLESSPKVMAQHLTTLDLDLLKVTGIHDLGLGVYSGLELMTLPHGRTLRQDIIERYQCLSLFVALTILMCSQLSDRVLMLHQWIQIALELRGHLGNLYGFSSVMEGLALPQITRLKITWLALKQSHSESAFIYDQRLQSLIFALDNASATLPLQNITIPHIMPLVQLLERDFSEIGTLLSWETGKGGSGMDIMLAHLDTARIVTQQCGLYRVTAENILREFKLRRDLVDMFRTEMHLKLLWGARGAIVNRTERFTKFPAVLDLLSRRMEADIEPDTSV